MDRLAFAALWLLTFSIPWQNSIAVPGVGTVSRMIGAAAVGVGLVALLASGTFRRLRAFHLLAVSFAVWSAFSLSWSIDVSASVTRALTFAQLVAFAVLLWQFGRTEERQNALLQAYILGAYVVAAGTVIGYVAGVDNYGGRYTATGFNPNDVACILALGIPIGWHLSYLSPHRSLVLVNAGYVPLAVVGAMLTGSRGGFLAVMMGLAIVPLSVHRLSVKARLGLSLLATASLLAIFAVVPDQLLSRVAGVPEDLVQGNLTGRLAIWEAGLRLFFERPLLGVGIGAYSQAVEPILGEAVPAHQTFLSVLAESGAVGLTIYGSMVVAALWPIHRMRGGQRRFWAVLALTLLVGLMPRSWEYDKATWLLLSLAVAQSAALRREESVVSRHLRAVRQAGASPPGWPTVAASRELR